MSRKDALLRLHQRLTEKRDQLRQMLSFELEQGRRPRDVGDIGDDAVNDNETELNSQIIAFETEELTQIERALEMIRTGQYGSCEECRKSIPIERLRALPFTSFCIRCQEREENGGNARDSGDVNWESACEFEGRFSEREVSLHDLQYDE